jgi:tetratricopeptide (TPR) repeat protein
LRATLEWSYTLLDRRLQRALRRLSVFRGTFSLEAAETVAGADLDDIAGLVDWNLLKPVGEGRFLMLETIREYGAELVDTHGEADELRNRHLDFFLALAEEAEPRLTGPDQREWYGRLRIEQDNIREALGYACDAGDGERALMLAGTIWRFWWNRGDTHEAAHWYARAFAIGEAASVKARARGLLGMAHVDESRADLALACRRFEEAADLFGSIGETRWRVIALVHLIGLTHDAGDAARAERLVVEARALAEESGDVRAASLITLNEGWRLLAGDGDLDSIRASSREALEGLRSIGDAYGVASGLDQLASVALRSGDVEDACRHLRESIELSRSIGDTQSLASTLGLAAAAAFARGESLRSARLWEAHEALCKAHGFDTELPPWLDELRTTARAAAGAPASASSELDLEAATELALEAVAA